MFNYGTFGGVLIYGALQTIGIILACILVYALIVAIRWKLFTKAGEAGWKALIPGYNLYLTFKLCWSTKWFWFILCAIIAMMVGIFIPLLGPVIYVAGILVILFVATFFCMQMAKAFDKDEAWGIGLMLLGPVFEFILAFDGNVKYVGPQEDPKFFSSIKSDITNEFNSLKKENYNEPTYTKQVDNNEVQINTENVLYETENTATKEEQLEKSNSVEDLLKNSNVLNKDELDAEINVIEPGNLK